MEEGFDHLRCPMCGGELVYSEGTHDLCCRNNPYELAGSPGPQAKEVEKGKAARGTAKNEGRKTALHETAADYLASGGEGRNGFTVPEEYGEKSSRDRGSVSENYILSADAERHSGTRTEGSNELKVSEFQGWKRT